MLAVFALPLLCVCVCIKDRLVNVCQSADQGRGEGACVPSFAQ